jgi:hypothetical protein
MKRLSKTPTGQFKLSLYREPPLQFDQPRREELLNVLADLLLEALGGQANAKEDEKEKIDESQNHI